MEDFITKKLFELAAGWSLPERFRLQKWTSHQKYDNFEKKFSKIDKKFVSQFIVEVHISVYLWKNY